MVRIHHRHLPIWNLVAHRFRCLGWVRRGGRYMTAEEDAVEVSDISTDYFGKALLKAGYQYYGTEPMYSGLLKSHYQT